MSVGVKPMVATVVGPEERARLEAAVSGRFAAVHVADLPEAIRAVRERPVRAVLFSPRRIAGSQIRGVASLIHSFPGVPAVAVVSEADQTSAERLLELGACGVRHLIDLRSRDGWHRLRQLVADPTTPAGARILRAVVPRLSGATPDCVRFFEAVVRLAPTIGTVRALARLLGERPSTFMSRFFRAALPSPKRYLAAVRILYAAWYLEDAGRSVVDVAYVLQYSSPQSFGRHLRTVLGVTAVEFRRRYPFPVAIDDFVARLVEPYRSRLRTFRPFTNGVRAIGHDAT